MPEVQLRLEVWRPARPDKRLLYERPDDGDQCPNELQADHLHEQVYGWRLFGDVWTSLGTGEMAIAIKEKLTVGFNPSLPPKERGFGEMRSVVKEMSTYLADAQNRRWQDWEQLTDEDDPDSTYRVQPLLSFYHHLRWLCDLFQDVPGASVTIR